jgi:putative FmdB family regulatory protein
MPLFDYRCERCGEQREVLARAAETDAPACPACGRRMERQLARVAVQTKGAAASCGAPRGGFS